MNTKNISDELQEKLETVLYLYETKEKELNEYKRRMTQAIPDENDIFKYMRLFQEFINESQARNWQIERTYNTKAAKNYIDVDFSKYRNFLDGRLDKEKHHDFRSFLIDMRLVEPATFEKNKGIIVGPAKERKKVLRIRQEVYKRMSGNLAG